MFESLFTAPTKIGAWFGDKSVNLTLEDGINAAINIGLTGWVINVAAFKRQPMDEVGLFISALSQMGYGFISSGGLAMKDGQATEGDFD